MPAFMADAGEPKVTGLPSIRIVPPDRPVDTEKHPRDLGSPAADEPAETQDLP